MSKHTKVAILVAPILAVIGYIAADYYTEYQAKKDKIYQLVNDTPCDVLAHKCVLKSGDLKVSIYDDAGITTINSTFPLDKATLFLVDTHDQGKAYPLGMTNSPYYWHSKTPLRAQLENSGKTQKMRLIANIKGGKYLAEFYTNQLK
ncbi:MAG: hypothetical protein JKX78_10775 [Alteromonadaceae bacterium]|nr:hypothetical protein [Alteromonadaceae bacterium]